MPLMRHQSFQKLNKMEVVLPKFKFLDQDSIANTQGLGSIPKVRLERRLGKLSDDVMTEVKNAISFALDLDVAGSGQQKRLL